MRARHARAAHPAQAARAVGAINTANTVNTTINAAARASLVYSLTLTFCILRAKPEHEEALGKYRELSKKCTNPATTAKAFTLLELVIALAIAAVIAAFAFASYRSQIARGHRTDASAAIYRAAQFAESAGPVDSQAPDIATLPAGLDQSPQSGTAVYRLRLLPADESSGGYAIEASPVETGPMHDDPCGTFVLDATGQRTNRPVDETTPPRVDECWGGR